MSLARVRWRLGRAVLWLVAALAPVTRRTPGRRAEWGTLRRTRPFSSRYGFDRGRPVDRFYIERFLHESAGAIRGDVLEVGDPGYTRRFGASRVGASHVVDLDPANAHATIVADLCVPRSLPAEAYDCILLIQTLYLLKDERAALENVFRALRPDGTLLVTVPCIMRVDPQHPDGDFWRYTPRGLEERLRRAWPDADVHVEGHGNVLTAAAALMGLASEELTVAELDTEDDAFPIVACATVCKQVTAPRPRQISARMAVSVLGLLALSAAGLGLDRGASGGTPARAAEPAIPVEVERKGIGISHVRVGVTHTKVTADEAGDSDAVHRAWDLLARRERFQNQHIMGWGAANPQPSPRRFDWRSLDERMALIRGTRGIPVITLCCAPDWMKGGRAGRTDWGRLDAAPAPEHYDDYAALAARVAQRYPGVRRFQVWNEMKGFGFIRDGRWVWDYPAYTELYNRVYDAVKAVRPDALIGGPYAPIDVGTESMSDPSAELRGPWGIADQRALDGIDYWLEHKRGAQMLVFDTATVPKDCQAQTDEFSALEAFSDAAAWARKRTDLPIWIGEFYPTFEGSADDLPRQRAVLAAAYAELATAGVELAALWDPQGGSPWWRCGGRGGSCLNCLWTDTRRPGGGQPTPALRALDAFSRAFPPGTPLLRTRVGVDTLTALSSPRRTLLVNHLERRRRVSLEGRPVELDPYGVRVVERG